MENATKLTSKEIEVLKFINEDKKFSLKRNEKAIAEKFNLSDMQVNEMTRHFKEKGLIKKKKGRYVFIGEMILEVLFELI